MTTARYSTTDKWVKRLWYIYTMENYSIIKNEIVGQAKWLK
jgi:hypothetical protein